MNSFSSRRNRIKNQQWNFSTPKKTKCKQSLKNKIATLKQDEENVSVNIVAQDMSNDETEATTKMNQSILKWNKEVSALDFYKATISTSDTTKSTVLKFDEATNEFNSKENVSNSNSNTTVTSQNRLTKKSLKAKKMWTRIPIQMPSSEVLKQRDHIFEVLFTTSEDIINLEEIELPSTIPQILFLPSLYSSLITLWDILEYSYYEQDIDPTSTLSEPSSASLSIEELLYSETLS